MSVKGWFLVAFALVVLAIWLPRGLTLDQFVTPDEPAWLGRSANFYHALVTHNYADTFQHSHPGVMAMWVGTIIFHSEFTQYAWEATTRTLKNWKNVEPFLEENGQDPLRLLESSRSLMVLFNLMVLMLAFQAAGRLFGTWPALIGFLFIALDPFHVGLTRLLHLDGLVSNLIFLAFLAFLCYSFKGRRLIDLFLAIVATGFAWLTKSTAILLVPMFILVMSIDLVRNWRLDSRSYRQLIWQSIWPLAVWLIGSAAIFVAFWPSMWVNPIGTLARMFQTTLGYATRGHPSNVFFNGHVVDGDPGWLFYPISFLWRTTPAVLIGFGLVFIAFFFRRAPMDDPDRRLPALELFFWIVFYTVIMSIGVKKFDRYILPAIPPIDLLAGLGWMALVSWIVHRLRRPTSYLVSGGILALVIGSQAILTAQTYPYYLSYYNPLLGGPARASQVMMIGWGEGLDKAGRYIESLPNADTLQVMTHYPEGSVSYFFNGKLKNLPSTWKGLEALREKGVDYLVLYVHQRQRMIPDPQMNDYFAGQVPEFTARINGIDYAEVYNLHKLRP